MHYSPPPHARGVAARKLVSVAEGYRDGDQRHGTPAGPRARKTKDLSFAYPDEAHPLRLDDGDDDDVGDDGERAIVVRETVGQLGINHQLSLIHISEPTRPY